MSSTLDGQQVLPGQGGIRRVRRRLWAIAVAVVIMSVSGVAWAITSSRRGPLPNIAIQSPVDTTLSWFSAVNAQDMPLALAHFVPADREMMEWSSWGPPFTHLRCSLRSGGTRQADVRCTFADINEVDMSNVTFWDVYLVRESSGRWLIDDYGQG